MMPQPITDPNDACVLLHQLNELKLSIGEVQVSGLCSTCSALGKLLTQEISRHQSPFKKDKVSELAKEFNKISTGINKHLVQQLPLIRKQMQQSLNKMTSQKSKPTALSDLAQDQTYIKTTELLQENIVRLDQQLSIEMKRVLKVIPQTKQDDFQKLLEALKIYQLTLCRSSLLSAEYGRLSILLHCLSVDVELYLSKENAGPTKTKLLEFLSIIGNQISRNEALHELFQEQAVHDIPIMKVLDSAKQKYLSLGKQLTEGDMSNAGVLLAVAKRHETDTTLAHQLEEVQSIDEEFTALSKEVLGFLEKIDLHDINSQAEELIQSEPVGAAPVPVMLKKTKKTVDVALKQETKRDVASKPNSNESAKLADKPFGTQFHVELSKLADWLNLDVKALKNSTSDEKRELGQIIAEQLDDVYGQIDASRWPTGETEALEYKTDIEKRLSSLEQLIAEAMAQISPPQSPPASPQPETFKSPEKVVTPKARPIEQHGGSGANLPAFPAKFAAPQTASARSVPKPVTFEGQLQVAIQKLNSTRTRMFDAYSKQESFRQTLLKSNQPESLAWVNIDQTDWVLDFISQNIAYYPHAVFVKPYAEHRLPMAEMIRAIQTERFHPHFNQRNCQAYLGWASNWLDTFTPHLDYLEQLMSVTESMLTNQQRVA